MRVRIAEIKIQANKLKVKIMSEEKASKKEENPSSESSPEQLSPEILDMIKHPPRIDDAMRDLPVEERVTNPAMAPEMLDDRPGDLG
ncbi:hypothetical protein NIES4071_40960 [Calothrix sp. NIES-4071]|nr:hypothetical protein NIES4071_40960 [Calothrix sp. NIES-4071]BAZ58412.1 hypothetical protein NIES4105_40900 [Calothrix sp. NIES-4105]